MCEGLLIPYYVKSSINLFILSPDMFLDVLVQDIYNLSQTAIECFYSLFYLTRRVEEITQISYG
jgi:hypothetical protein